MEVKIPPCPQTHEPTGAPHYFTPSRHPTSPVQTYGRCVGSATAPPSGRVIPQVRGTSRPVPRVRS